MTDMIDFTREGATARMLIELADVPYFEVDANRNVVSMSPAMERMTGFQAEDILGRSCLRVHRCEECLKGCGVFDSGVVKDKKLDLYRADGTVVTVSKSGQVFLDDDGEITGAIEIVRPLDAIHHDEPDEARALRRALRDAKYRRSDAARALGMSRTTLWRKMKQYGL